MYSLLRRRRIAQIVLFNLSFRQQRRHPQRARRILRPQKLILPHRRLQSSSHHAARAPAPPAAPPPHSPPPAHARPPGRMIDRAIRIHRPRIIRPRPVALRNRLQRIAPPLRLLPRRQRSSPARLRRLAPRVVARACARRAAAHAAQPARQRTPQPSHRSNLDFEDPVNNHRLSLRAPAPPIPCRKPSPVLPPIPPPNTAKLQKPSARIKLSPWSRMSPWRQNIVIQERSAGSASVFAVQLQSQLYLQL